MYKTILRRVQNFGSLRTNYIKFHGEYGSLQGSEFLNPMDILDQTSTNITAGLTLDLSEQAKLNYQNMINSKLSDTDCSEFLNYGYLKSCNINQNMVK